MHFGGLPNAVGRGLGSRQLPFHVPHLCTAAPGNLLNWQQQGHLHRREGKWLPLDRIASPAITDAGVSSSGDRDMQTRENRIVAESFAAIIRVMRWGKRG